MDTLKKLKLEFDGMENIVKSYTSEGDILNFFNKLKEALANSDIESITYFVNEINTWYQRNISAIRSNEYVSNNDSHTRNISLFGEFAKDLENYQVKNEARGQVENLLFEKIFISHKSDDKKYGDALTEFLKGIGLKREQIIYTSHPLHKIRDGENIFRYLRHNINEKIYAIFLFSEKYLNSSICMNEMGAFWMIQSDYSNVFVPNFNFQNEQFLKCVADSNKIGFSFINDSMNITGLIEFKDNIVDRFGLQPIDDKVWNDVLEKFKSAIS